MYRCTVASVHRPVLSRQCGLLQATQQEERQRRGEALAGKMWLSLDREAENPCEAQLTYLFEVNKGNKSSIKYLTNTDTSRRILILMRTLRFLMMRMMMQPLKTRRTQTGSLLSGRRQILMMPSRTSLTNITQITQRSWTVDSGYLSFNIAFTLSSYWSFFKIILCFYMLIFIWSLVPVIKISYCHTFNCFPRLHWHPPKQGRRRIIFITGTSIFMYFHINAKGFLSTPARAWNLYPAGFEHSWREKIFLEPNIMSVSG